MDGYAAHTSMAINTGRDKAYVDRHTHTYVTYTYIGGTLRYYPEYRARTRTKREDL